MIVLILQPPEYYLVVLFINNGVQMHDTEQKFYIQLIRNKLSTVYDILHDIESEITNR